MADEHSGFFASVLKNSNVRFVRKQENVLKAINTKESFELLTELFAGNDMYEQRKIVRDIKLIKMIDMI